MLIQDPNSKTILLRCPDCGQPFRFPRQDIVWMLEAQKKNPALKVICTRCGRLEMWRTHKGN